MTEGGGGGVVEAPAPSARAPECASAATAAAVDGFNHLGTGSMNRGRQPGGAAGGRAPHASGREGGELAAAGADSAKRTAAEPFNDAALGKGRQKGKPPVPNRSGLPLWNPDEAYRKNRAYLDELAKGSAGPPKPRSSDSGVPFRELEKVQDRARAQAESIQLWNRAALQRYIQGEKARAAGKLT